MVCIIHLPACCNCSAVGPEGCPPLADDVEVVGDVEVAELICLINVSAKIFLVIFDPVNWTRQIGQDLKAGLSLHWSQKEWPLEHWNIFFGGFISSIHTGQSNKSSLCIFGNNLSSK